MASAANIIAMLSPIVTMFCRGDDSERTRPARLLPQSPSRIASTTSEFRKEIERYGPKMERNDVKLIASPRTPETPRSILHRLRRVSTDTHIFASNARSQTLRICTDATRMNPTKSALCRAPPTLAQ